MTLSAPLQQTSSRLSIREWLVQNPYQIAAVFLCTAFALLMIVNNQLGGESMWFWYATIFHRGAKLYSTLHTALQPFFVLETNAWMRLLGNTLLLTQLPSLLHAILLAVGILLVLQESKWPDWQRALVLLGTFVLTVSGHSYRFDDYHVVAECFITYALLVLLHLARVREERRQLALVAVLGLIAGLTTTTRLTDGAALLVASLLSLPVLLKRRRLLSLALLLGVTATTVLAVVGLTGDSFSAYVANSILHAAGSKGGTGSIFAAPFLMVRNTVGLLASNKRLLLALLALLALGPLARRFWPRGTRFLVGLQLLAAALFVLVAGSRTRVELLTGSLIGALVLALTTLMYVLAPVVAVRWGRAVREGRAWDRREILLLLPLGEWASYSAGAGAEPLMNYYAPVALLLLLFPVIEPLRKQAATVSAWFVTVVTLIAVSGVCSKIVIPYSWQNYAYRPMFQNREWYRHPVYGPMYIDSDLLHFSVAVCKDIGGDAGIERTGAPVELLSLPYPYANYFCGTPPWHDYVQTFFDTATRSTVDGMMRELDASPPEWILYQRQLKIMSGSERLYNHGHPIAQRDLDAMIMERLAQHRWTLIEKRNYLEGDGWFIIHTKPQAGAASPQ